MMRPNPADWLAFHAHTRPQARALAAPAEGVLYDYASLHARVERLAGGLAARGVTAGARLAVLALNHSDTLCLTLACARLGAMLLPLNWRLTASELQYQLDDAEPAWLWHDDAHAALAGQLSGPTCAPLATLDDWLAAPLHPTPDIDPETPLLLLYTSGTTGRPKGALLSQRMLAANADNTALSWDLSGADSSVAHAPFFHTGGLNVLTLPLLQRGGFSVLLPRFDPGQVLSAIVNWRLSVLFAVPTMFQMLADHPDFATLAVIANQLRGKLAAIPHVSDVESSFDDADPALSVEVKRDAAARAGVNLDRVGATLSTLLAGTTPPAAATPASTASTRNTPCPSGIR